MRLVRLYTVHLWHLVASVNTTQCFKIMAQAPLGGNPLEITDETYLTKTRGMGYSMVKTA